MIDQYVLASNDDGELAIRTVQATESSSVTDTTSVITATDDGKLAVRVVGAGGGGDSHNKGYYATQSALETAYPTAEAGDYAIVGSTDTVWLWDTDNEEWVDSDQKGQVTSVNGQTGDVVLDLLPSQTGNAGKFLTTDGTDASWAAVDALPSQTGNAGKFLTTNGTDASWSRYLYIDSAVKVSDSLTAMGTLSVVVGGSASATRNGAIAIGYGSSSSANMGVTVGPDSQVASAYGCAYGYGARIGNNATYAIQIGSTGSPTTNSDANTFKVANANGNFEIMSADGTIPTARLTNAINKYSTMPTASSTNEGWIVQFTGTTDANYTHGYIYECVSDGGNPATYSWSNIQVQAGGGSSYSAGTGIDITNGTISVADPVASLEAPSGGSVGSVYGMWADKTTISKYGCVILGNKAAVTSTSAAGSVALGAETAVGNGAIAIGGSAKARATDSIAIGNSATTGYNSSAIQLGFGTNSNPNSFQVWSYQLLNKSDGTIPTARLTKVNTTITLTAAGWSSNTQTVTVTGMTATGVVLVSPDPTDQSAYTSAGIICTTQAADSLTFTCSTTPTADIDVNVVML